MALHLLQKNMLMKMKMKKLYYQKIIDAWTQLFDPAERSILARDSKKRPSKRKDGDTVKRRKTRNTKYDPKTITPLSRVRLCSVFLTRSHCQSNAI